MTSVRASAGVYGVVDECVIMSIDTSLKDGDVRYRIPPLSPRPKASGRTVQ